MKIKLKNKLELLRLIATILIIGSVWSCNLTGRKNIHEAYIYEHEIKHGDIDTAKKLTGRLTFNKSGEVIEVAEIGSNGEPYRVKKYKYQDDTLLLEKSDYYRDKIEYKRLYEYDNRLKSLVKVYFSSKNKSDDLQLWGALRIYRNNKGDAIRKAYIGGIDLFEEESSQPVDSETGELTFSKVDSTIAIYHYNPQGKPDTIKIYTKGYQVSTIVDGEWKVLRDFRFYAFTYDTKGNIKTAVDPLEIRTEYFYRADTLISETESSDRGNWTKKTYFDSVGNRTLIQFTSAGEDKYNWRIEYQYDEFGNEINRTRYNYLNEPDFHSSRRLIYY